MFVLSGEIRDGDHTRDVFDLLDDLGPKLRASRRRNRRMGEAAQ